MDVKSVGTFPVILLKLATPPLPPQTKLNLEQNGWKWVLFLATTLLGEVGGRRNELKAEQKIVYRSRVLCNNCLEGRFHTVPSKYCKYPVCALPSWAPCFCTFFGDRVRKLKNTYAVEFIYSKLSYLILVCLQHDAVHHRSEKQPEYSGTPTGMQKKKLLYLLESWAKLRHLLQKKKEINALRIADSSKQAKRESPLYDL